MKEFLLAVGILVLAFFVWEPSSSSYVPQRNSLYSVTYRVTGETSFSLTYETENGGTAQIDSVQKMWNYSFKAPEGQFVYVSAQNNGQYGDIVCEILVNGKVAKRTVSNGAYVIATCSGSL